jgi:Domain of unknown function (DUF4864)
MAMIAKLFFAFVVVAGLGGAARADGPSGADRQTIHSLITNQIDAFRKDDGAAAYSYASPTIKDLFQSPEAFMQMVRQGYPPVYRPQSVTFGDMVDTPAGPMQKVFLTGPDGKGYVALYALQRQPDGSWLINGCSLVEADGPSI